MTQETVKDIIYLFVIIIESLVLLNYLDKIHNYKNLINMYRRISERQYSDILLYKMLLKDYGNKNTVL